MAPTTIGRYQIQAELGHGAMGVVYRGFDPNIGRPVAIKTILVDTGNPEAVKRLQREAQAAGILSHPNIVTIYDAGEHEGLFYIAMELVEGETLHQVLARGPMPLEPAISIVEQAGAALDYAHARKIIHRDIKPANIMLTAGTVKVMDFGIAKTTGAALTTTGELLGTPAYMSPELIKGMGADGRSDLFSLGAMFYEMLTAAKPFAGDNISNILYKILQEYPPDLSAVNPSLPPGLDEVMRKAMAKEPAARYPNCAQFLTDLKNYRALAEKRVLIGGAKPAAVAVPSPASRGAVVADREEGRAVPLAVESRTPVPGWVRKRKSLLGVAAGALLALLAGVLWQGGHTPTPIPQAPSEPTGAPVPGVPAPRPAPTAPSERSRAPRARARPGTAIPGEVGHVAIHTDPQGARIFINGQQTPYRSPVNLSLAPDRYQITVERGGFARQTREVVVKKDQLIQMRLELQRKPD